MKNRDFTPIVALGNVRQKSNTRSVLPRLTTGFTLIELLVVIAVIAILSTVVVASVKSAQIKSRNTTRATAARQIATAFNMAVNDGKALPAVGNACISAVCTPDGFYSTSEVLDTYLEPYLTGKPIDPPGGTRNFTGFVFISGSSNIVFWTMEGANTAGICAPGEVNTYGSGYVECRIPIKQ